ncbi:hypothetical protein NOMA109596_06295 [Nocardioides marinus]|uniref:DUF5658 domain-containing protein n=1 Tax=Nocardioides marinus TaxID=374514 RepID=A0A7Y9YDD3_9ACTN|nr:hypothetical protein [Nocardioides marinus]NYI10143.1 hypothetical protein [Nocardioides marinus]
MTTLIHSRRTSGHGGAATSLRAELASAGADVVGQARSSGAALRRHSPWVRLVVALWTIAIVGDGLTTVLMMGTGRFEEANGAAAFFMGLVGVAGWVLISGLLCVALASLTLSRPRTTYAWTAATVALMVCLGKLWTTASNALLWANATA